MWKKTWIVILIGESLLSWKLIFVACSSGCLHAVTSYVHIMVYMSLTCYCLIRLIHAVISNQVILKVLSRAIFPQHYENKVWNKNYSIPNLFNNRLADYMERRLELGVTWQSTKTGQTCSRNTSAAPTMNSSAAIVWLLPPPFTKAWNQINTKDQPQRNCSQFFVEEYIGVRKTSLVSVKKTSMLCFKPSWSVIHGERETLSNTIKSWDG